METSNLLHEAKMAHNDGCLNNHTEDDCLAIQLAKFVEGLGTRREEWRVTGWPQGYPKYDFTFGSPGRHARGEDADPEAAAREFVQPWRDGKHTPWIDGPHLSSRVIYTSEWKDED